MSDADFLILREVPDKEQNSQRIQETRQREIPDSPHESFESFSSVTNTPARSINKENSAPDTLLKNSSNPLKQQQEVVKNLKADNYGLKIKIASLTKYLNSNFHLPENVKKLVAENSDLKQEIGRLSGAQSSADSSSLRQIETLQSEKSELEAEVRRLKTSNDNHLHQELRIKDHELEEKLLLLQQLQAKCERLEKSKADDLADNDRLEELLVDKEAEINQLKQSLEKMKSSDYEIKMQASETGTRIRSLENQLSQSRSEVSSLKVKLKSIEGSGSSVQKKAAQLSEEVERKSGRILELSQMIKELRAEKAGDEAEIERLKSYASSLENQIHSGSSYDLENEILRMRSMENELRSEISRYKIEIADLRAELENQSGDTTLLESAAQIEAERDQAYNDLKVYEDHIFTLETQLEEAHLRAEQAYEAQRDAENRALETERVLSAQSRPQKERGGFFGLFSSGEEKDRDTRSNLLAIKRLMKEKEDLQDEIRSMELKMKHLSADLEAERTQNLSLGRYEKEEIARLAKQKNELEVRLADKEALFEGEMNEHRNRTNKLHEKIGNLQKEIERLNRENKQASKDGSGVDREEHMKVVRDSMEKEKEAMKLGYELEALKTEHQMKIEMLNREISSLKKSLTESVKPVSEIGELKGMIEKKDQELSEKTTKVQEKEKEVQEKEKEIGKVKEDLEKMRDNYEKIYAKYKALSEAEPLEVGQEEKERLEEKYRKLESRYKATKERLTDRIKQLQKSLEVAKLEAGVANMQLEGKDIRTLEQSVYYYREKFHKELYKSQDLKFMNEYLKSLLKKSEEQLMNDVEYLIQAGSIKGMKYEDLDTKYLTQFFLPKRQKLTLRVLAKAVLAGVRIKNRWMKGEKKRRVLQAVEQKVKCGV